MIVGNRADGKNIGERIATGFEEYYRDAVKIREIWCKGECCCTLSFVTKRRCHRGVMLMMANLSKKKETMV